MLRLPQLKTDQMPKEIATTWINELTAILVAKIGIGKVNRAKLMAYPPQSLTKASKELNLALTRRLTLISLQRLKKILILRSKSIYFATDTTTQFLLWLRRCMSREQTKTLSRMSNRLSSIWAKHSIRVREKRFSIFGSDQYLWL